MDLNLYTETLIKTLMDLQSDYQDLGQCMCSEDPGARLLVLLNDKFDRSIPVLIKAICDLEAYVPQSEDSNLSVSAGSHREGQPEKV